MNKDKSEMSLWEKVQREKARDPYKENLIKLAKKHYFGGKEILGERNADLKGLPYPERMMKLGQRHFLGIFK